MLKGEFFTLSAVLAARHLGDGVGQQLPGRLPRPGADDAEPVRAGRAAPRPSAGHRSGDEVLRARRAGQRLPALRPVDDVRRDRLARPRRGLQGDRHRPHQQGGADLRPGVRRRRPGLQARRRAVPHVGARRLPGRAHRGDAAAGRRAPSWRRLRSRSACSSTACPKQPAFPPRRAPDQRGAIRPRDSRASSSTAKIPCPAAMPCCSGPPTFTSRRSGAITSSIAAM